MSLQLSAGKAIGAGFLAGLVAAIAMTTVMLLLACFGIATPLTIIGDRISVFFKPEPFLELMGRVGGYNQLKQLGVGSTIAGQLLFGALGGAIFGFFMRRNPARRSIAVTMAVFVLLPTLVMAIALWPVLGTHYRGLPIEAARLVTLIGFALSVLVFERTLVAGFQFLTRARSTGETSEFSPAIGRRAFVLSGLGILIAGGGVALGRKLYRAATFSYDGTQYKGRIVQPITPNDQFYCVTKNIVDPEVDVRLWHLEVNGLVEKPVTFQFEHIKSINPVEQETTLMCISNGLDAGLMSNAVWKGVAMRDLLETASPLSGAAKVKLHGVDNYTDTITLEKAMDPATIIAYEMNGATLPHRHGYPARVVVPGYFGEKNVKWLTRIEVAGADAKGFYETQGWGPNFIIPTRSRIDVPSHNEKIDMHDAQNGINVRGIAFGGDRGISKVEVSFDDGKNWSEAKIDYPGTKLTWALWSFDWRPQTTGDYKLVVRATDGEAAAQKWEEDRPFKSGATGFHKIVVHMTA
jgi:DMSO/TMAO reductase YedYZ molybdopterin-dependent catalytic subunit